MTDSGSVGWGFESLRGHLVKSVPPGTLFSLLSVTFDQHMRIDKFLWCIRLFKSRSLATEACQKDRIKLNDREVKPSAEVNIGDRVALREPPIWRVFEIVQLPSTRMGAKLVPEHMKEVTPWEDLEKQEIARKVKADSRDPGTGRPTKQDRRAMERYKGE